MNLKFKNITIKGRVTIAVLLVVLIVSVIACYFMFRCPIVFKPVFRSSHHESLEVYKVVI